MTTNPMVQVFVSTSLTPDFVPAIKSSDSEFLLDLASIPTLEGNETGLIAMVMALTSQAQLLEKFSELQKKQRLFQFECLIAMEAQLILISRPLSK
jgi:hypothetical protein